MGYASGRTPSRPVLWNPEMAESSLPKITLIPAIETLLSIFPENHCLSIKENIEKGRGFTSSPT
jgi:hypothetical protein